MRPQTEIMEDLVSQVRGLSTRMRNFDPEMMERGMHPSSSRFQHFYPMMMDEIMMSKEYRGGSYGLLIIAGFFRDSMPWVSEVLVEAHRELKSASPKQAKRITSDLRRTLKFMTRSHFAEMMMDDSKHSHMMIMEPPHMVERFVGRIATWHIGQGVEGEIESDDDDLI